MQILYRRCAALDVHKKTVCACIRQKRGKSEVEVSQETFGTFSDDLERLGLWLKQHKVKRVAMESTGVYWIPVWNILEQPRFGLDLLLVNPVLVKALPGQKSDPKDANRIAELHQYGLLRGSFIPPPRIRRLRDLVRQRVHLQQDKNRIVNRITRLLETANVKLGSVASNIVGTSGRRMLYAMAEGQRDPARLASLAVGSLQSKEGELARALRGRFTPHFRSLLTDLLEDLQYAERRIERIERDVRADLSAHADLIRRLCTIPGVDEITAWTILSEIGLDMSVFPTPEHLSSWAGLCPGNDESAGKRRSGTTRKGNRYLRRGLIQNAWAIGHCKSGFLTSLFLRVARRRGMKRAAVAVAHRVLIIAYHIIRDGVVYRELGGDYQDRLHPLRTTKRLVERLGNLGYQVELRPKSADPAPERGAQPEPRTDADASVRRGPGRPKGSTGRGFVRHQALIGIPRPRCRKCAGWGIPCIHARNRIANNRSPDPTQ